MSIKKVLLLIVCYKAQSSITSVLERIPQNIWKNEHYHTESLIIDNVSQDKTFNIAEEYASKHPEWNITILYNPKRQGYGSNQKLGYFYAIRGGFDIIVVMHEEGRHAPEHLDRMIMPIVDNETDAVFSSEMIQFMDIFKNKEVFCKWFSNQILTCVKNKIIRSKLSEFHGNHRAYNVHVLKTIPFKHNSNDYDFDTDIIIQLTDKKKSVQEIPIPIFYGNEISLRQRIPNAFKEIQSCILSRVIKYGIYYHPKFDYEPDSNYRYREKFGYPSSQQFAFDQVPHGATVIDIGCGPGFMAEKLNSKKVKTASIDLQIQYRMKEHSWKSIKADVEKYDFDEEFGKVDHILALDIIEHLKSPERLLTVLRKRFSKDAPKLIITTGNIGFFPIRLGLLFSSFNYGKRGILDMDHTRLFTFSTLQKTLEMNGYEIKNKIGIPAPFPLATGNGRLSYILLLINQALIFISKSLFSYQIAIIAKPLPTLEDLLEDAYEEKKRKQINNKTISQIK